MEHLRQPKIVVVAVDKDKGSEAAYWTLLKVVRPEMDKVVFVHARPQKEKKPDAKTASPATMDFFRSHHKKWQEIEEQHTKEVLEKFSDMARDAGLNYTAEEVEGDTRHALIKKAAAVSADILIVGNRGRSVVAGLMLGSVSEYLVHHAHCAVLVARTTEEEKKIEQ
jgi:nucleotide-binding universal stress UspA family protein